MEKLFSLALGPLIEQIAPLLFTTGRPPRGEIGGPCKRPGAEVDRQLVMSRCLQISSGDLVNNRKWEYTRQSKIRAEDFVLISYKQSKCI